jgi:aspartate/glutamate racemase
MPSCSGSELSYLFTCVIDFCMNSAERLLPKVDAPYASTDPIASRVRAAWDMLDRTGLWHVRSRNSQATSCKDAASRRKRLGAQGIPLYDELKTMCVTFITDAGDRRFALLHCRAHERLDMERVKVALNCATAPTRLNSEQLFAHCSAAYGTVNPFSEPDRFMQVFDDGVLLPLTAPHTMMTNAGGFEDAIEFEPATLIETLKNDGVEVKVCLIRLARGADQAAPAALKLPVLGLITGNGPESGMALWRHINATVHARLTTDKRMRGDLSFPRVILHSLPEMGLSMELISREKMVWHELEKCVKHLLESGATHVALACNTTPYFSPQIQAIATTYGACFISIAQVTANYLQNRGLRSATLLGIPSVAEMGAYSAYQSLGELGVVPASPEVQPLLSELGYLVKRMELVGQDAKPLNKLQQILRTGVHTKHAIIALTEISVLLERFPKLRERIRDIEIIDPLQLLGEELADAYLRRLPDEDAVDHEEWSF